MSRRPNNTGSICLEKSTGKFRAAVSVNGKRIVKRFTTEEDAKRWITITQADVYQGKFRDPSKITFQEFSEQYMELYTKELRPTTYSIYCHWLSKLEPIYKTKLQNLTALQLQKVINDIPIARTAKIHVRNMAKRILKKAVELELLNKNVAENVTVPKVKSTAPITQEDIFTQDEIDKILDAAKKFGRSRNYYLFILTAVLTGMRIGEIIALRYQDIKNGYLDINSSVTSISGHSYETPPKTDAGARKVYVPYTLCDMLKSNDSIGTLPHDYVFHTRTMNHWNPTNVEAEWLIILDRAGVKRKNFHKLRHTHASVLAQNNVSFIEIASRLGHANPNVTVQIYSHIIPGREREIVDKVTESFPSLLE